MKNSFWDAVGIPFKIESIEQETLEKAVSVAFKGNKYCFYGSSWFIDVKNRFRTFKFKNASYVIKEVSGKKADLEIANSRQAYQKIEGKAVGSRIIKIVVPKKIVLREENQRFFLVSEYLGSDLNESAYAKAALRLSLEDCLTVVKLLLESGIAYRGYLPKNIVMTDGFLFLFDWEDASFLNGPLPSKFDHLWRTQFLLNWGNLFSFNDLDKGLKEFVGIEYPLVEPSLMGYEKTFKDIVNIRSSNTTFLRNEIDRIVFGAEKPLAKRCDHFNIHPYDTGCLVADIFSDDIDVLYDVLSYVFRLHYESEFCFHMEIMSRLFVEYYRALEGNTILKSQIQYYFLIPILMMLDEPISKEDCEEILSTSGLDKLVMKVFQLMSDQSVTKHYLSGNKKDDLERLLRSRIREKIVEAFPGTELENAKYIDKMIVLILQQGNNLKGSQ